MSSIKDEKRNRSLLIDPIGAAYRYNFDARDNCIDRFLPMGSTLKWLTIEISFITPL